MSGMIDSHNCFKFLVAAEQLPNIAGELRESCLDFVENSVETVFEEREGIQDEIKSLDFWTVVDICVRVGRGVGWVIEPAACLKHIMDALRTWSCTRFGPDAGTPLGLYKAMQALKFEEWRTHAAELSHTVKLMRSDLITDRHLESDTLSVSGYDAKLQLQTKRAEANCALFLKVSCESMPPAWWPCTVNIVCDSNRRKKKKK
mmetsp:Transcript_86633/g.153314  ORF Transcript_86633/g.153314 Transcript_86633/m.153314 type:complete len:203 (+) Transcript_86633:3-611(+)